MDVRLVDKINQLYCDLACNLKMDLDIKNYGLKQCLNIGISSLDKNPKFVKIVTDLLKYYNNYTQDELTSIDNKCNPDPNCTPILDCGCLTTCSCNIFKIIKKI